jgi:hypothetical protein
MARHTVFALWVHLDQHLFCAHDLDDLSDIRAWLLEETKLFSQ